MSSATRLLASIAFLLGLSLPASGQPAKVWKVGYLGNTPTDASADTARAWAAFVQELRDRGYAEGRNLVLERRFAEGKPDRYAALAAELAQLKLDVIVAAANVGARTMKEATSSTPIVMLFVSDPVGMGMVADMARPGGNVTGLADFTVDLIPKRLEFLRTMMPTASRVVYLRCFRCAALDTPAATEIARKNAWDTAARELGLELTYVDLSSGTDLDTALQATQRAQPQAVFLGPNPVNFFLRRELADFAAKRRLPMFGFAREMAGLGNVLTYGPSLSDQFRKAAVFVDRILKGAKPAELSVEQPTKLELVINARSAKALGLTIPPNLLNLADEVID